MKQPYNFLALPGISFIILMPVYGLAARIPVLGNPQLQEYVQMTQINFSILQRIHVPSPSQREIDQRSRYFTFPDYIVETAGFTRIQPVKNGKAQRLLTGAGPPAVQQPLHTQSPEIPEAFPAVNPVRSYVVSPADYHSPLRPANPPNLSGATAGQRTDAPLPIARLSGAPELTPIALFSLHAVHGLLARENNTSACCRSKAMGNYPARVAEPSAYSYMLAAFGLFIFGQVMRR